MIKNDFFRYINHIYNLIQVFLKIFKNMNILINAVQEGNTDMVYTLLKRHDIDINYRNDNGNTALIEAAIKGDTELVKMLMEHPDIDINSRNLEGDTALIEAVWNNKEVIVSMLLEHPDIDTDFP